MQRPSDAEFLQAYEEHADAVFRFCYVQTGDRDSAKDAVQETFVRTWKYMCLGKKINQIRPFLYRTARNIVIDRHRRKKTSSLDEMREQGFDVAGDTNLERTAQASLAMQSIQQLDPKYKEILSLRFVQGLMPNEIAQVVNENVNTISVRINRGLEQVRKMLNIEK